MDKEEEDKDNLKQRLLPGNQERSQEDIDDEYKSCKSDDDEQSMREDHRNGHDAKMNSSLNFRNDDREEEKNGDISENSHSAFEDGIRERQRDGPAGSRSSSRPPALNMPSKKEKAKQQGKTFFRELLDFLYFCYEFLMVMVVIGTGIILPAIPNCLYVLLSILYIGMVIKLSTARMSTTLCTAIVGVMMVLSILFLVVKIILSILIREGSVSYDAKLYLSLGIAISPGDLDGWEITKTFLCDFSSVVVSILLLIGSIIRNKKKVDEFSEENIGKLKVTGARSPSFWIGVFILFTGLAGIVSPSLIAITFSILSAVGLYTWALYFDIQGPVMKFVVYIALATSALYINVSFIIQVKFFEEIQNDWMDYVGLDSFDSNHERFGEHLSGYVMVVCVYIISLIYIKASSRLDTKNKYLQRKISLKPRKRSQTLEDEGLIQTFLSQVRALLKSPQMHLFILRGCAFFWIYLYFCFQSILPLFFLLHSVIYNHKDFFLGTLKFVYTPGLWMIFFFDYFVNIKSLFSDDIYKRENYRYGIFDYKVAFYHLLFQLFTCSYACFVLYMFRDYEEDLKEAQRRKEEKEKAKAERRARLLNRNSNMGKSSVRVASFYSQDNFSTQFSRKRKAYTYEILFRYLIKNVDILLMVMLYYAGCNRIDVYHVSLLIFFAIYIMYPDKFRNYFIFLLYFMSFIASIKYFYVLFLPEFSDENNRRINDTFEVLGWATDIDEDNDKYFRSNLFNNNYLLVFTGWIQYTLYTSNYSKAAFSEEQVKEDSETFSKKYPKLTTWLTVVSELVQMAIPWLTYSLFIVIAILNNKSIINWIMFTFNLLLLFWHVSADLVTAKSHQRLTFGWRLYTMMAALCFAIILTYQILCMDQISGSKFARDFIDKLPEFITLNTEIIGLQDFTNFKKIELAVKFLAYVAYFNMSVITRRQLQKSSVNVSQYQNDPSVDANPSSDSDQDINGGPDKPIEVKFSLVFIIYKLKRVWPVLDFLAWHMFTALSITVMLLAIYWKLSVVSLVYIILILYFYIVTPFKLQPRISSLKENNKQGMTVGEIKTLWEEERQRTEKSMISLKNQIIVMIAFVSVVCMSLLHLSANLQTLKVTYQEDSDNWEDIIFYTFFAGVNYNEQDGGNTYGYEIYGFIVLLAFCVIERKSEIWLSNKFGYKGSKYDTVKGNFMLEKYGSELKDKKKRKTTSPRSPSPDLEVIPEEDKEMELRSSSMLKAIDLNHLSTISKQMKKHKSEMPSLDPEEEFKKMKEEQKKKQVKEILYMDYLVRILKGFRVFLYTIILLMALLSVVHKSNVFAVVLLVATMVASFRGCNYSNLKWYLFLVVFVMCLQYLSALSNLSSENSPEVFPTPFNDRGVERPIKVPLYTEMKKPFVETVKSGPEQGELRPTKWGFYIGLIVSENRLHYLWMDWIILMLIYYYFLYFNSASYELNLSLSTDESLHKAIQEIEGDVEESVSEKFNESVHHNPSVQSNGEGSFHSISDSMMRRERSTKREAIDYVEMVKKKMIIYKIYNSFSVGISATSTIISLVCLLMIAFQVQGFINLFYICFCLYFIAQAINFIYQTKWRFPNYLGKILKPVVIAEITIQILFQIPWSAIHKNETAPKSWQTIIGFYSIWDLDANGYPEPVNASNVVYKCFMYAFIILQENIFSSVEYERFTHRTLRDIQRLSEMKAEAMAYLYNNQKIKTTINNQFEKDKMIKKLAQVNKQLKKWNQTVFNESDAKKKAIEGLQTSRQKKIHDKKIKEAPEHEEEEEQSAFDEDPPKMKKIDAAPRPEDIKKIEGEGEGDEVQVHRLKEYEGLDRGELIAKLVSDRLGLFWKIYILGIRYLTNQILIVFNRKKLEKILEDIENGETKIYTGIEQKVLQDFEQDKETMLKNEYETFEKIPDKERATRAQKATKGHRLVIAFISLFFNMLISNTVFVCYLLMIVAHIMNGSLVSLVYPISIFIYALLEERRPKKRYWQVIILYSSIILVLKFLLQTYPISDWLTDGEVSNPDKGATTYSFNDFLRTIRLGIEVVVQGKNFVNYFLFEALILLSVTFHMFIQIFAGVWDEREVDKESIHEAAARIANVQKKRALEKVGREIQERPKHLKKRNQEIDPRNDILFVDHADRIRKRSYSFNDIANLREIREYKKEQGLDDSLRNEFPQDLGRWSEFEDNFFHGGEPYNDELYPDLDQVMEDARITRDRALYSRAKRMKSWAVEESFISRIKNLTRKQYFAELKEELELLKEEFELQEEGEQENEASQKLELKPDYHLSEYHYIEPTREELANFIIENKPGAGAVSKFFRKLGVMLTHSHYFESLFPSIKEQKPGLDLYAPMAAVQCIIIIFMIFFYTRMDPDYTNFTADDLTPNQLNSIMVVAVFIQIAIIVLDRYLYLSRDYVVIDEVDIEGEEEDNESDGEEPGRAQSISAFDRAKSFDLRSGSGAKLLNKAMGIEKKIPKMKGSLRESRQLDDIPDDDEVLPEEVQLRQTKFNKTIVIKYYLQLFMLIGIHVAVFWYFPIKANQKIQAEPYCIYNDPETGNSCNEVFMNLTLVVFYLLYCVYFALSALQIRYGLPELRKGNFAMGDTGPVNKGIFQGYLAAPFIVELKIVSDWTFTRTSLDLFQWIKFENIYADLFIAKCTNKAYIEHPLGEPIAFIKKMLLGCCGLFILIVLIAGPLLFFSGFNPLAEDNFITGGSLRFVIEANLTDKGAVNTYELFNSDRVAALKPISDEYYGDLNAMSKTIKNLERRLWQEVVFSKVSDTAWDLSYPTKKEIYEKVANAVDNQTLGINLALIYTFDRPYPAGMQKVDKALPYINIVDPSVKYRYKVRQALQQALNPDRKCDPDTPISFDVENWLLPTMRLPQDDKPKVIWITRNRKEFITVSVAQKCAINPNTAQVTFWWEVTQKNYTGDTGAPPSEPQGIVFFTWSEKVTNDIIGYSLVAFYAIVILGIGRALRAVIQTDSNDIFIKDMPRPDSLLLICEGILISRMENNLEREEELFFVLIDIMRSPEILKMITESSLKKKKE